MDKRYVQLPVRIFGLLHRQHKVVRINQFLTYAKARYVKRSRKEILLTHLAALERTFAPDKQDAISLWFRSGQHSSALDSIIGDKATQDNAVEVEVDGVEVECSVCMVSFTSSQFPRKKLAPTCHHEPTACLACLAQSLERQIEDLPWDQVSCPECPERLSFDVVKEFSSKAAFERYDKKSVLAAFQDMANFTMCLGPKCDSGQIHGGGNDQPIMTCTSCHFRTCFTHKMPWHDGQTCAEYDAEQTERNRQEKATAKYLTKKTKVCPNPKCGLNLNKYIGCDHVTCTRCRYEFCWICFASYDDIRLHGNGSHAEDCKYHSHRLPGYAGH